MNFVVELSGIYKIICLSNKKIYIGSSINVDRRFKNHISLLKHNKHDNKYLQNAWNEYGEKNFRFEVIEIVHNINNLSVREKWWLDTTKCYKRETGFNISSNPCSPETRRSVDLTGQKFGRLMAIRPNGKDKYGNIIWLCGCECGNIINTVTRNLNNGNTKSCGCSRTKHGQTINGKSSKIHSVWRQINQRCCNKNCKEYIRYGKRGVKICRRWSNKNPRGFENFYKDVGDAPKGKSLDRINNNKGYFPNNWRWATPKEQSRNRKNNKTYKFNDKELCITEISEKFNIKRSTLMYRLNSGQSIEKATTTPTGKYKRG